MSSFTYLRGAVLVAMVACSDRRSPAPATEAGSPVPPAKVIASDANVDAAPVNPFVIEERVESYETFVSVHRRDAACPSIDWRRKARGLRFEHCRDRSLADQVAELRALLTHLRAVEGPVIEQAQFTGSVDYFSYPEFARRLAQHATREPWKPKGKITLNQYVVDTAAQQELAPELTAIFAGIGLRPSLRSVEKCSEGTAGTKGDIGPWLAAERISGKNIPVGCSIGWFELIR